MNWLARLALDRPGATLFTTGVLTVALAAGTLRLELRTDGAVLRPHGDPVIEQNATDEMRFRDPRVSLLLVKASPPNSLATPQAFRFIRGLHDGLRRQRVLRPTGSLSLHRIRGCDDVSFSTFTDFV